MKTLSSAPIGARRLRSTPRAERDRHSVTLQNVCAGKRYPSSIWIIRAGSGSVCNAWRGGNKMNFFDRLFGRKKSADSAKERLQLVLVHDRTDLTPAELDTLKDDLINTI